MTETPTTPTAPTEGGGFDDLLEANRAFAADFHLGGFDGIARRGVALVTCMDSRIDPLGMLGLSPGDAKIFRNPGGRVTDAALEALVLATHLLGVDRVLVVPHTRCAVASNSEAELRERVGQSAGADATWMSFGVITDQRRALREDLARVRSHPLTKEGTLVGGFLYDVDSGLLEPVD
ncbi:beta-class carbonic anhydrase [Terracoccus luteus]|uniref:carbonic anhydrase n=1 Tax=Terracoccus luteus TaxID=53356 RepID=A0A495Y1N0_9MICO|nr:carbonic anhydrase [Terracoccus luteus]MBB2985933.1 carbonic anhydrase [Terracoccus luteus]MCP2171585.1 carbonic anhydrase [Terracoccus luteus]RKT78693.1 carbonic anhydrase [Terracoccus luteus]